MEARPCSAITQAGAPCKGRAGANGLCMIHDPALAERRALGKQQGGKNKATSARARRLWREAGTQTAEDVLATLAIATRRVMAGTIEPSVGSAVAALSRAWFAGKQVVATEDLAQRMAALEAASKKPEDA